MTRFAIAACVVSLLASAAVTPALAADKLIVESAPVRISDLDLNSARGAHALFHRVNVVAGDLCAQTQSALFPWAPDTERACRIKAVTRAISRLNAPLVNAEFVRVYGPGDTALAAK